MVIVFYVVTGVVIIEAGGCRRVGDHEMGG